MNILDQIIAQKQIEIHENKNSVSINELKENSLFSRKCISLKERLQSKKGSGIIAEFKRKSPSKSWINENADAVKVTKGYEQNGADAISVLTDHLFFGARKDDFKDVRNNVAIPVLRKDFIIDSYQIYETKAMGADILLLIAKILKPEQVNHFTELAHQLGLEVLLEMQDENEVRHYRESDADFFGINNRNLTDFSVDFENSARLASLLPPQKIKIAESGISTAKDILYLRQVGFEGFLMGTEFMKNEKPETSCKDFINTLYTLNENKDLRS